MFLHNNTLKFSSFVVLRMWNNFAKLIYLEQSKVYLPGKNNRYTWYSVCQWKSEKQNCVDKKGLDRI